MCGSIDGHRAPSQVKISDPQAFLSSYLIPSDRCDAPRIATIQRYAQKSGRCRGFGADFVSIYSSGF